MPLYVGYDIYVKEAKLIQATDSKLSKHVANLLHVCLGVEYMKCHSMSGKKPGKSGNDVKPGLCADFVKCFVRKFLIFMRFMTVFRLLSYPIIV